MALTKIPGSLLDTASGINGLIYPTSDGTSGQFLKTDGSGNLSFATVTGYTDSDVETYLDGGTSTPTFASAIVSGALTVTGDLNITGDINSYNVTDLDVTDQTITLGAGQIEANSGGSGIIIDGSNASILWNETNDVFDFNKGITTIGTVHNDSTQVGFRHTAHGIATGNTNKHGFQIGRWIGAYDKWMLVPETEGTPTYSRELGFDFVNNNWFVEGPFYINDNVGIGVTNPGAYLHIYGTNAEQLRLEGNDEYTYLRFQGTPSGGSSSALGDIGFGNYSGAAIDLNIANRQNGSLTFHTGTSFTERMRIDTNGYLRLSETSKTHNSSYIALTTPNGVLITDDTGGASKSTTLTHNAYVDGSNNWAYMHADEAARLQFFNGTITLSNAAAGSADGTITWNDRLKIDSSGSVTIDTDTNSRFTIGDGGNNAITLYGGSGDELYVGANATYKLRFKTDGNIVMDNGGAFGIGTSTPTAGVALDVQNYLRAGNLYLGNLGGTHRLEGGNGHIYPGDMKLLAGASGMNIDFAVVVTGVGISTEARLDSPTGDWYTNDGTVSSLSDERVKTDITDLSDGLEIVKQLRPVTFKYNDNSEDEKGHKRMGAARDKVRYGFIAQEVEEVAPQYVETGIGYINNEEVDDFKSMSTTRMIPMLFKAIQELSTELDVAKARITELENA